VRSGGSVAAMHEERQERASTRSVTDVVARLTDAASNRGMTVFATIDHAAAARAAGLALHDEVVVILGAPKVGTALMAADARAGLDLPLRVLVWDDEGTTRLTWRDPRDLRAAHHLDQLGEALQAMHDGLERVVDAAA
jgi:uncharacterized protein (DUF302 family)